MKKVLTTYSVSRADIEAAIMNILREKYPELRDEFEGELTFHYGVNNDDGRNQGNRTLGANARLEAIIQVSEEKP